MLLNGINFRNFNKYRLKLGKVNEIIASTISNDNKLDKKKGRRVLWTRGVQKWRFSEKFGNNL